MSTSIFIEQLAAGHAADAKETLSNLLSARAFEALDARKQELGATLFGNQVEEEVEELDEISDKTLKSYTKNKKEVEGSGVGRLGSGYSYDKSQEGTRSATRRLQARKNQIGKYGEVPKVPGYNKEEVEGVEESMDQPMSKNLAKGYTSNQEHGDKAPKMSDKQKAAAKAARDARDAADMKKLFATSDAEMRKSK